MRLTFNDGTVLYYSYQISRITGSSASLLGLLLAMANTQGKTYTAVSAPGKVLLAGGYLVLDREYTGLVFGLSARIHVIVQAASTARGDGDSDGELVTVKSPQFVDAEWRYSTTILPDGAGVVVKQLERYDIDLRNILLFTKPPPVPPSPATRLLKPP